MKRSRKANNTHKTRQKERARGERITSDKEERIGAGWKSLKTKAQNTRSIFENQKVLKAKLTFNILKTEIINDRALSRLIGLLVFLALAGFGLENSKLGNPYISES